MGLFDIFKKKKRPETVINELENAEDFVTIAKILAENDLISTPKDEHHNTFGDDLRHLTPDGELPWGWVSYYKDFIKCQEAKIQKAWDKVYSCKSTTQKLDAFKKYFAAVSRIGDLCKKTGECHYKWFCECIIGSVWYNDQMKDYRQLEIDAPELIRREKLLETLETDVMEKLNENNGILQSNFIKMFDPVIKNDISSFLYYAEKYGKIKRTKSGRSYILELTK